MSFDYAFRSVQDEKGVIQTIDFLAKQDLGYPKYDEWVQKVETELFAGFKRAALAYSYGGLVGDVVWQAHKKRARTREVKNVRIDPKERGRYLASFLLRQVECEGKGSFDSIIIDARETQKDMIGLLMGMGYSVAGKINLYEEGRKDVVLFKDFSNQNSKNLVALLQGLGVSA